MRSLSHQSHENRPDHFLKQRGKNVDMPNQDLIVDRTGVGDDQLHLSEPRLFSDYVLTVHVPIVAIHSLVVNRPKRLTPGSNPAEQGYSAPSIGRNTPAAGVSRPHGNHPASGLTSTQHPPPHNPLTRSRSAPAPPASPAQRSLPSLRANLGNVSKTRGARITRSHFPSLRLCVSAVNNPS